MKLMFSEEAELMCTMNYRVINGDWQGTRDGDTFTCDWNGECKFINDWIEIESDDLTEKEREHWYIGNYIPERGSTRYYGENNNYDEHFKER